MGAETFFVIRENGMLQGWGHDSYGTIKPQNEWINNLDYPILQAFYYYRPWPIFPVNMKKGMQFIDSGNWITLAIDKDGGLWGWGINFSGLLGGKDVPEQRPIRLMEHVKTASVGSQTCLALQDDGSVWTWGFDSRNQFVAVTDSLILDKPQKCFSGAKYAAIYGEKCCVIDKNGDLYIWGGGFKADEMDVVLSWEAPLKIAEDVVQTADITGGLLILKSDHTLWSWDLTSIGTTTDSLRKVMADVRTCRSRTLIDNSGIVFTWDQAKDENLLKGQADFQPSEFFIQVDKDAMDAECAGDYIYFVDSRNRLLRALCYDSDGNFNVQAPSVIKYGIMSPY